MTSFHALTVGQMTEFHRILASAGMTKEDVESILSTPEKGMYVASVARIKVLVVKELFTTHPSFGDLTGILKPKGNFDLQKVVRRP